MRQQITCLVSFFVLVFVFGASPAVLAQSATPAAAAEPPVAALPTPAGMSVPRLGELLLQVDPNLNQQGPTWQLQFRDRPLIVIADNNADRMRIMSPVIESEGLDQQELQRLLQANFDSALDARYAIAQGTLWSVFIHPLSPLTDRQLSSAIVQVYYTAATFGTIYSSGELTFSAGDSNQALPEQEPQP